MSDNTEALPKLEPPTRAQIRSATAYRIIEQIILDVHERLMGKGGHMTRADAETILENWEPDLRRYMIMIEECVTHAYMHGRADLSAAMHAQEVRQFDDHEALDEAIELSERPIAFTDSPYMRHPVHGGGRGV